MSLDEARQYHMSLHIVLHCPRGLSLCNFGVAQRPYMSDDSTCIRHDAFGEGVSTTVGALVCEEAAIVKYRR